MTRLRRPAVAGTFYPADPTELKTAVSGYLAAAAAQDRAEIAHATAPKAIIAPHAGYVYSGPIAASVYAHIAQLRARVERVVLMGPSHRVPLRGLGASSADAFSTPLGDVPIDQELALALARSGKDIEILEAAHASEHSIETQIPFLQRILKNFHIVPIVMGNPDLATARRIGEAVANVVEEHSEQGKRIVVIASTDMAHYPKREDAERSDKLALQDRRRRSAGLGSDPRSR